MTQFPPREGRWVEAGEGSQGRAPALLPAGIPALLSMENPWEIVRAAVSKAKSWHGAHPGGFSCFATGLLAERSAGLLPECGVPSPGSRFGGGGGVERMVREGEHSSEDASPPAGGVVGDMELFSVEAGHPLLPAAGEARGALGSSR